MTVVTSEPPPSQWLTIDGTNWAYYEHTLEQIGEGHLRVTYDRGRMEIMSPWGWHERVKKAFSLLIEAYALDANVPFLALGSVTCRREDQDRGLEPDECYYFRDLPPISKERGLDLSIDPPPDLAVEIDVSRSSIPRQPIYASLGVPEIWRFDGNGSSFYSASPMGPICLLTPASLSRNCR